MTKIAVINAVIDHYFSSSAGLYRNHLQAEGHPVIKFVLSDDDVVLAHRRVEGMNFNPGGYSYPEWCVANLGDENQMIGGTDEFANISNPHVTRSSAGGQGTGPSSMSVDLRMAPQAEVVQRVSPVGQPQVTSAGRRVPIRRGRLSWSMTDTRRTPHKFS
jgi:hypothetical protein